MNHHANPAPETKANLGEENQISRAFEAFQRTFSEFRYANDERLNQLEKRSSADIITSEKVDRINTALDDQKAAIDQLIIRKSQPPAARSKPYDSLDLKHMQAFDTYVRQGAETGLRDLEEKALSYNSNPDGGYLVPDQIADEIDQRLNAISPIRSIAKKQTVSTSTFKKPFSVNGPSVGWVGETAARPQTDTPTISELQFPTMELYAMPAATPTLLEDTAIDVDGWLIGEIENAFAEQEAAAFVNGDGINKPTGFLSVPTVAESGWSWGSLGYVATGTDGDFAASDASDILLDTVYALKSGYRQNSNWVMNRSTQAAIRKLKDADGNYIWQAPATSDSKAQLLGFGIVESEDVPDIASDSLSIAFGDFSRGYLVVDRAGVNVLRDPYSAKPYVLFYTTKRVGGGILDFDAIKLVKFGTA